jgi:malate dehydrogenase
MTALDENRAKGQLALKACVRAEDIHNMAIWGNHSSTMYPDFEHARIGGQGCESVIKDRSWLETTFITTVQQRGAAIIDMRGKSSAASAASACIDQIKAYSVATPTHDVFSAAVMSQGEYGVPQGLMYSFPLRSDGKGNVHIVQGWELSLFAQAKLKTTADELLKERALIQDLLPH